ncbi:haloacid dehalogenase-like hydrolase [gut metagenome]|uniref:Haloacid dehalogenase-like hydrolase n=1 Tax=gut metagenome TaxID=749906 RepID=J9GGC4_9ZZZZ
MLASGRPTYGILPLAEQLDMQKYGGFVLSFNGGKILDCASHEVIYEQALPDEVLPLLYHTSLEAGASILSYNGPKILSETPDNEYVQYEAFLTKMEIEGTDNFLRDLNRPADKCLAVGKPELIAWLEVEMKQKLEEQINIYRSEPFYLELVPKGIDKAASIKRLLDHLQLDREGVIAMGDGFNDLSMIHYAGLGVAMCNAVDAVKAEADVITRHNNDEDGVAHFLLEELPTINKGA